MKWNKHSRLEGAHAFLAASKYSWINYDDEKVVESYLANQAKQLGTELHDVAAKLIKLGIRQRNTKQTFNMYVNDAIRFAMKVEQPLFYSENAFGTADAICFRNNKLRIHDYKSGTTKAHMHQLEVYAAFFCLEYAHKPQDIEMELRIYQNDQIFSHVPTPEFIWNIMGRIITADKIIEETKNGV